MASGTEAAETVARLALEGDLGVAVCESLTSGAIASTLGAAPRASEWFRGGIVAYAASVKHELLDVPPGPVVCSAAVTSMALSTGELVDADVVLAVSGVGGPGPQDGIPAGTVCFAVSTPWRVETDEQHFDGEPGEVLDQTIAHGVALLVRALEETSSASAAAGEGAEAPAWGGVVRGRPNRRA